MSQVTLFSWAHPLSFAKPLDHTWVSDFAPPQPEQPADSNYWYCWGEYHGSYSHQLASGSAALEVAAAISEPNTPAIPHGTPPYKPSSISGSITYYGLDGVCHNVANQILASTGTPATMAKTVEGANGYPLSTFFFGTYGLNETDWAKIVAAHLSGVQLAGDQFLPFMAVAGLTPAEAKNVGAIRAKAHSAFADIRQRIALKGRDYYPEVIVVALAALGAVRLEVGHDKFFKLFPSADLKSAEWLRPPVL